MLKADIARFLALASDDEAVRVDAAAQLSGLSWAHFDRHPADSRKMPPGWSEALVAAWRATSSSSVQAWIAQAVSLVVPEDYKHVAPLALEFLDTDGPYFYEVVRFSMELGRCLPGAKERILALHRHRDPSVRSLLAAKLGQRWFADGFFDFDADVAFVRTLMLDPAGSVRHEALKIAEANLEHLTTDDFEVLLEAASLERASRRTRTLELIQKVASKLGYSPEAFASRMSPLRTDGVYYTSVTELDHVGRWVTQRCLRFADGRVTAFGTDEAPVDLDHALSNATRDGAEGVVRRDGDRIEFLVEMSGGATDYLGRIDGDRIICARRDRGASQQIDEEYVFTFVDWDNPAPRAPAPAPKKSRGKPVEPLPFELVRPDSLRIADAAKWYLLMVRRLPVFIDGIEGDEQRLRRTWFLKNEMRKAAVKALYDPTLSREFLAAMPLPDLEALMVDPAQGQHSLSAVTPAERGAFPGTLQECIGATMVGVGCMYVMTEHGWQKQ